MERHFRTCNLCEAMCGLVLTVDEGRVTDVRGDDEDVLSRGHICPKGYALRELQEDPDRLREPVRRTKSGWQRVTWEEALAEAAERLGAIRRAHGADAVGIYAGNPIVHNHGAAVGLQGFMRALRTKNRFDANSQDANPKLAACLLMYGDSLSLTVPDIDRTDHLLMLGANPLASNGSLMSLGDVKGRLRGVRARGGRIVLVDPRRTETAGEVDEHHFIRPGADAAFVLALIHTLFADGRVDRAALQQTARGLDAIERIAAGFPPERVAARVGIAAEEIRRIARAFASAERPVAYGRVGVCTQEFGTLASFAIEALNVVAGRFDREGGLMFATPAVDLGAIGRKLMAGRYGRWRSRVRGLPEVAGQLPAAVIAEEIETPGEGRIRGFVTLAGNPVLSVPNGERIAGALATLEFMVSIDICVNETTRHAHLILPPVGPLSRSHYDVVLHALAVRNTAKFSPPVVPRAPGEKTDWEILYELGMRLGGMKFGVPALDGMLKALWRAGYAPDVDRVVDLALRIGPYGDRFNPLSKGLNLARLKRAPHGVDLGPLVPGARGKVRTDDGKVDLAPAPIVDDVPRLARWLDAPAPALTLIGRRHVRTNNSWMHNCRSLVKGPDRSALLLHPDDAKARGVVAGDTVRVRSRVGAIEARVEVTEDVMPGVACLPHGYGHAQVADTMRVAGAVVGPNMNAITDDMFLDPISGTAALSGVPVEIEKIAVAAAS